MSDNTGNKKRSTSKNPTPAHRKRRPVSNAASDGTPGVRKKKKKRPSAKMVEMSSGNQVTIDDVMDQNENDADSASAESKKSKVSLEKREAETMEEPEVMPDLLPDEQTDAASDPNIWKNQAKSIVIWMASVLLLALTFFQGESMWTVIHNTLLGIFGFKMFVWAGLLVFSGYLITKQVDDVTILNIIRPAAGIILLTDVLGYIMIQSNGYRNVYNEISLGFFQLFDQIFSDGAKLGGTGLLGGLLGELMMFAVGRNGAAIITSVLLLALIMVVSRTGPLDLLAQFKRNVKLLLSADFYRQLFDRSDTERRMKQDDDDDLYEVIPFEDEDNSVIKQEDAFDFEINNAAEAREFDPDAGSDISESGPDESFSETTRDASQKKKSKKLTKAEEIKAESDDFSRQVESGEAAADGTDEQEYKYPPVRLLIPSKNSNSADDEEEIIETEALLIQTLEEYGVKASIVNTSRGPTVTRYEIKPAPGVKISKIKNLSDDIALRLAAKSVRIEAPIPGRSAVGIEIPNLNKQMVRIRELLDSREFTEAKGSLTVALGKDIEGHNVFCDLSKMPHLLIAGSTGSGKSVCVNSMLISILYKYSPKEVRMVLIDPKSVEFDMYNGIPHLLVPVVCEPKKAAGALQWAVSEMLKRYGMLKEHSVRNIDGYNRLAEQTGQFEKLCRIVIVIDEMADLMIASPKEVEDAIFRLAAMARAAGMYMVLATQRPSVDVITGTIKNNIPSRIALAVSSQVDSRTILDEGGAENLIGYGDMLYHPMGAGKHIRVQGCFVDDAEVDRVIRFVKQNGHAEYDDSIADEIERNSLENAGESAAEFDGKDEYFEKAVEVVTEAGQASTSMLQRRLGVGYARAGRIIDQLEKFGIIGPHEGSKPRAVLITRAQWMEMTLSRTHAGKNDPIVRSHSEFAAQTLDNGHEEITARQSEFFNANLNDAYDEFGDDEFDAAGSDGIPTDSAEFGVEEDGTDVDGSDAEFIPQGNGSNEIEIEVEPERTERDPDLFEQSDRNDDSGGLSVDVETDISDFFRELNTPRKGSGTRDFSAFFEDEPEEEEDFFRFANEAPSTGNHADDSDEDGNNKADFLDLSNEAASTGNHADDSYDDGNNKADFLDLSNEAPSTGNHADDSYKERNITDFLAFIRETPSADNHVDYSSDDEDEVDFLDFTNEASSGDNHVDYSVDDEDEVDFLNYSNEAPSSEHHTDSDGGGIVDVPPWEDVPLSDPDNRSSDEKRNQVILDDDDDILLSSWIKKL